MIRLDKNRWSGQTSNLDRSLELRFKEIEKRFADKAREVARETAVELAVKTFPRGSAPNSESRAAIAGDLRKVFATAGEVFGVLREQRGKRVAGAFYRSWKDGNLTDATAILRQAGGDFGSLRFGPVSPSLHEAARSGPRKRVTLAFPLVIVSGSARDAYIAKIQKEIGKSASGWSACAAILGGESGIPSWKTTSVHGSRYGSVRELDGSRVGFVLSNRAPNALRTLPIGDALEIVKKARRRFLEALSE